LENSRYYCCVDRVALLQGIPLFEEISAEDLEELAQTLSVKKYRSRHQIFKQGAIGSTMYIILSGQVNIYLPASPDNLPLQTMYPGDYFGELALFDNEPRSASAIAISDVVLLELMQTTMLGFVQQRPHVAMVLLATLASRLRATNALLFERAAKNVDAEMDKKLTWQDRLADRVAELNGSWWFILGLMGVTITWVLVNDGNFLGLSFDPYPFVFYNLVLAILVSLQGPLIVMSQNRQAIKDRVRADNDYRVNLKNEVNIETLLLEIRRLNAELSSGLNDLEHQIQDNQLTTKQLQTDLTKMFSLEDDLDSMESDWD
jgi:CRP/FNR family cyclic AMP-dependent transcriptional regulator